MSVMSLTVCPAPAISFDVIHHGEFLNVVLSLYELLERYSIDQTSLAMVMSNCNVD